MTDLDRCFVQFIHPGGESNILGQLLAARVGELSKRVTSR
jgi:hypothetical protein